jgi:hypothetical protein
MTPIILQGSKRLRTEKDLQIKASSKDDKERHHAMHHKKPNYHEGRGKCLKKYGNGWTGNG